MGSLERNELSVLVGGSIVTNSSSCQDMALSTSATGVTAILMPTSE